MKKPLVILGLLVAMVYACNQNDKQNALLSTNALPSQIFTIDITKDTALRTKKGAIIRIPQGALKAGSSSVQLEIKEAYSMQDIIRAGLQTQSNGQPLSSGGMIYINAVGEEKVTITRSVAVAIPTSFIDSNMKLFKGAEKDGVIDWTDPAPMLQNPQMVKLEAGRQLFVNNCASCHALGKDLTGPDLAHVIKRLSRFKTEEGFHDVYAFTRNPAAMMARHDYYCYLKQEFSGVVMTGFPDLTDTDLGKLYGWIENESELKNLPMPGMHTINCMDSCHEYNRIAGKWEEMKTNYEKDSVDMVIEHRDFAAAPPIDTSTYEYDTVPVKELDFVDPNAGKSLYYQFNIDLFGWFNVDILMKDLPGTLESELVVRMQGQYKDRFQMYLVIPSIRAFIPAGPLSTAPGTYGFFTKDGKIPLPQDHQAYILAMGEHEDKLLFDLKDFITQQKQQLDIELKTGSKEEFTKLISSLGLPDATIKVADTYHADDLRKAIKELKKVEHLKPKNCDCNCSTDAPAAAKDSLERRGS